MSTYGPVNGLWTAGSYDLLTTILRKEWGYQGIVMTDWWAKINEEGESGSKSQTVPMVRAQNDIYMVTADAASNSNKDNTAEGLADGQADQSAAYAECCKHLLLPVTFRCHGEAAWQRGRGVYGASQSGKHRRSRRQRTGAGPAGTAGSRRPAKRLNFRWRSCPRRKVLVRYTSCVSRRSDGTNWYSG